MSSHGKKRMSAMLGLCSAMSVRQTEFVIGVDNTGKVTVAD